MGANSVQAKRSSAIKTGDLERLFSEKRFSDNIDTLNTGLANITFADNVGGQIKDITRPIPAGEEINIPHNLKTTPLGVIIMRMQGNGIIRDGEVPWDSTKITARNHGPDPITFLRIFIVRN